MAEVQKTAGGEWTRSVYYADGSGEIFELCVYAVALVGCLPALQWMPHPRGYLTGLAGCKLIQAQRIYTPHENRHPARHQASPEGR